MIARLWHGRVPSKKSKSYHDYLLETGLKDYAKIEGNRGVFLLLKIPAFGNTQTVSGKFKRLSV